MKTIFTAVFTWLISYGLIAQDTFSIIAFDDETGEIGSAGATCVDGIKQWGGIKVLNEIVPGVGGVNAQAWICLNPHVNLDNAISQLEDGKSPQDIIDWLKENDACSSQNFNPEYRQYGIVALEGDLGKPNSFAAAFTGDKADDYKGHLVGPNYAIQGNILLDSTVLYNMEKGFTETKGSLAKKLMAAMQGANIAGADSRCLARGTSSTSAFLRVAGNGDTKGNPYLELSIDEMPFGKEPIDSLQKLFDNWVLSSEKPVVEIGVFPNPAHEVITIQIGFEGENKQIFVVNALGQTVLKTNTSSQAITINTSTLPTGTYLIKMEMENAFVGRTEFIKR